VIVLIAPSAASAAACTDTWTGPAEGSWTTAANWSAGHVPTESDVACIGTGKTVNVTAGTQKASVLQGEGAVKIEKSTLELLSSSEASQIKSLTMKFEAVLGGPATLKVTGSFSWPNQSTMSGTGTTIIEPGITGSMAAAKVNLVGRRFINRGTLTYSRQIVMSEGALFENTGTLLAAAPEAIRAAEGSKAAPSFVNIGTLKKIEGTSEAPVEVSFENRGTVNGEKGSFAFRTASPTFTLANGSVLEGGIAFKEASVTAESFTGSSVVRLMKKATMTMPSGASSTVGGLTMEFESTLNGAGALTISNNLSWTNESTMSGTGSTVLGPAASGTVTTGGGTAKIERRTFVNEGSFAENGGALRLSEATVLENKGTLTVNDQEGSSVFSGGGTTQPTIVNTGTVQKTEGTGSSHVQVDIENRGMLKGKTGTLTFDRVGGSARLAAGSGIEGAVLFSEVTVTADNISVGGTTTIEHCELTVPSGETATFGNLVVRFAGKVTGQGTLRISESLAWTNESTMSGTGATVIAPGATASVTTGGGYAKVVERAFVNEGSLSVNAGLLRLSEGMVFDNKGTLTVNNEGPAAAIAVGEGATAPLLLNEGLLQKTAGSGAASVAVNVENKWRIDAATGTLALNNKGGVVFFAAGSTLEGSIVLENDTGGGETFASTGNLTIDHAALDILEGATPTVSKLTMRFESLLTGQGTITVAGELHWDQQSTMSGGGVTKLLPASNSNIDTGATMSTLARTLVNEGSLTMTQGSRLEIVEGVRLKNYGTFRLNQQPEHSSTELIKGNGHFLNTGSLERTEGTGSARVSAPFENLGVIHEISGPIAFDNPVKAETAEEFGKHACAGDPVDCATGNLSEAATDISIGGRGVGLSLARTYSAQAAAAASSPGAFGYGWSASFSDHLTVEEAGAKVTLTKSNGRTVPFTRTSGTAYAAPAWSRETLAGSPEAGYTFTALDRTVSRFSGAGRLEAIADANGNETALAYDEAGRLKTVTDPAGRQLAFSYNAGGQVESVEDPIGHLVNYAYEGGKLVSVTLPGEGGPRWQFKYDGSHRITEVIDGRGGKTTNEYDGSNRVISQTDPAGRTTTFAYEGFHTTITNKATGAATDEWFTSNNEPYSITHGYGTPQGTTKTFAYNEAGQLVRSTDGNGHSTTYGYDEAGNRTSERDALGHETKWTYNSAHQVASITTPRGETTTIERDASGNVESVSRPAPGASTQTTGFNYDEHGQLESLTDPLGRTWNYSYDSYGDLASEADPLGQTRTLGYDEDSRLVSTVSPRGNLEGANPSEYETTIERDAQGRPLKTTAPLGHATEYSYDANGNLASITDAKGHATEYSYGADNERTKVEKPNGAILETGYDSAGNVSSQTDANKHTTTYVRNVLEQPVEVVDPLGRKTLREYDAAGNLAKVTDPAERTTIYSYDAANRLIGINYSEEATPDASFQYDADGNLVKTIDGTGESTFAYDQLGRLTESKNGHGEAVKYTYDLGEEQTALAYPNGKEVTRTYDKAGRLESITDWLGGKTGFSYDADSNLTGVAFPTESGNSDVYSYDPASRLSEARFKKGAGTLASLTYTRDALGQVEHEARHGLPGPEELSYGYDEASRLVKAGSESFEYDPADNLTKGFGSTNSYDAASQLESGTGLTYAYDKVGERTKATPTSGPATSYGYDQASDLTSVSRPEEGEIPAISETLAYDGGGLLASKTASLTTQHLAWDTSAEVPMLLTDGQRNYVYGPSGLPVEQINSEEVPIYLHHDQLGSTRMLTGKGGEATGTFSYAPYGALESGTGSATTPLAYAGQYTDAETRLQYLRARFYDPATGQFLTRDPIVELTREPYSYAQQDPLNVIDPKGLAGELAAGGCVAGEVIEPLGGCAPGALTGAAAETVAAAGAGLLGWLAAEASDTESPSGDEGEPCLEPAIDPWVRDKEIGDRAQTHTEAAQFLEQIGISAGSNPEDPYGNGPRWKQKAAAIARLISHLANPRG
jgi:RHS repeat-associated protein